MIRIVWPATKTFDAPFHECVSKPQQNVSHVRAGSWLEHLAIAHENGEVTNTAVFVATTDDDVNVVIAATRMNSTYTGFPMTKLQLCSDGAKLHSQALTQRLKMAQDMFVIQSWLKPILVN